MERKLLEDFPEHVQREVRQTLDAEARRLLAESRATEQRDGDPSRPDRPVSGRDGGAPDRGTNQGPFSVER